MRARSNYNGILDVLQVHSSEAALEVVDQWKQSVEDAQREQTQSQRDATRKYASQINQLERDNRFLAKERDELRVKYEGPDKQEEETRMVLREEAFQSQVELLQQATQKESKRTVLERYVEG
jgi:flagella basal body P-ring formation protein FlgA